MRELGRFVWKIEHLRFLAPRNVSKITSAYSLYEHRVDFAAVEKALDSDAVKTDLALRVPIRKVLDDLIALMRSQDKAGGITQSFVQSLSLTTGPEAQKILGEYLLGIWRKGRELAIGELPEKLQERIHQFEFCPTGEGGGIDPTCSPGEGDHGGKDLVRDSNNKPITVYHGTRSQFDNFDPEQLGKNADHPSAHLGFFFTADKNTAGTFATGGKGRIISANIAMKKPLIMEASDYEKEYDFWRGIKGSSEYKRSKAHFENFVADMQDKGYDGIIIRGGKTKYPELASDNYIVFNTSQIKKFSIDIKYFAGLEPIQAINFFQNLRPWLIKGIIDDELKKTARLELTEHLKGGRTLTETIGNLRSAWEPWIGDPEKVIPSGISGTAEDILQAYRLENIVRTESITALSQGRAEIGDEAGDFVVGYELSPVLDERTSEICNRIGDLQESDRPVMFRKNDSRSERLIPALHWNCRTIPVFITSDDLPVRWSTEAELDSVLRLVPPGFK